MLGDLVEPLNAALRFYEGQGVGHIGHVSGKAQLGHHGQRGGDVVLAGGGDAAFVVQLVVQAEGELLVVEPTRGAEVGARDGAAAAVVRIEVFVDDLP